MPRRRRHVPLPPDLDELSEILGDGAIPIRIRESVEEDETDRQEWNEANLLDTSILEETD